MIRDERLWKNCSYLVSRYSLFHFHPVKCPLELSWFMLPQISNVAIIGLISESEFMISSDSWSIIQYNLWTKNNIPSNSVQRLASQCLCSTLERKFRMSLCYSGVSVDVHWRTFDPLMSRSGGNRRSCWVMASSPCSPNAWCSTPTSSPWQPTMCSSRSVFLRHTFGPCLQHIVFTHVSICSIFASFFSLYFFCFLHSI